MRRLLTTLPLALMVVSSLQMSATAEPICIELESVTVGPVTPPPPLNRPIGPVTTPYQQVCVL